LTLKIEHFKINAFFEIGGALGGTVLLVFIGFD